jgi:hypothetical protein
MTKLIEAIIDKDLTLAKSIFEEKMNNITLTKLHEAKKITAARHSYDDLNEEIDLINEARFKIVKARIRGGKVQRRRKVATQPGYTFRGGRLTRMSPQERRKRRLGQRRGKIKRKAKLSRTLMKRKRSLMRRRSIGVG